MSGGVLPAEKGFPTDEERAGHPGGPAQGDKPEEAYRGVATMRASEPLPEADAFPAP
jgi:hypothetical protein